MALPVINANDTNNPHIMLITLLVLLHASQVWLNFSEFSWIIQELKCCFVNALTLQFFNKNSLSYRF